MNLAEYDYQMWRKALHELQIKIDNFDNDFWTNVIDNHIEGEAYDIVEKQWKLDRQKLVDELEAHHKSSPPFPVNK